MNKGILISILLLAMPPVVISKTISFSGDKAHGKMLTIAAVGDILMHEPLQRKAAKDGYISLWEQVVPYLKQADITYGNLEGPIADGVSKTGKIVEDPGHRYDNNVYSSYPKFNTHPNLAKALSESGFDIVSFANNHALDRYGIGVERTIENLKKVDLKQVGAKSQVQKHPWYLITHKNNFSIAWIACTQDTNGISDTNNQVLYCYKKQDQKIIFEDIAALKNKVDATIVLPHWGVQYQQEPNDMQKNFAHRLLNAGAIAVIGNHPHCLQPLEKYVTQDGREALVAYSLGNFVSYQGTPKNRASIILYLTLQKTEKGAKIAKLSYLPLYMENRNGLQNIKLRILTSKDKGSVGYRVITQILPKDYMQHL